MFVGLLLQQQGFFEVIKRVRIGLIRTLWIYKELLQVLYANTDSSSATGLSIGVFFPILPILTRLKTR